MDQFFLSPPSVADSVRPSVVFSEMVDGLKIWGTLKVWSSSNTMSFDGEYFAFIPTKI